MSIGFPVTKDILDQRLGSRVLELRDTFVRIQAIKAWLDDRDDATLKAAPFSYTQAEVDKARAAYAALDKLVRVAHGQDTVPVADNFMFHGLDLVGLD